MSTKYHPLTEWALEQQKKWKGLKETDKEALEILKEYNKRIGTKFNPSDHWSAITIENARMAANGFKSVEEAKEAGVNLSHKSHSGYVNDGFKAVQDPDYKYNKYISERIDDSEIKIGDYLVGGRESTKNWKFEDFEKAAKNNSGYESHGSAVVFKGIDNNGEYVILADGNWSDTYANRKVYVKDLAQKGYAVKVTDTNPTSNSQVEQSSTRRSPLDISLEKSKDVEDTGEVIEDTKDIEDIEDDSVLDEGPAIEEQLQYATSSGSSNQFRLSDEAQMQLFGTIVYPRNAEGASIISPEGDPWEYKKEGDDFYTKKKEDEEWIPTDGAVSNNIKENIFNESCEDGNCKDEEYSETNPFENLQAEYAEKEKEEPWWKTLDLEESRSYAKDPYIAYLDGDMSTKDYKKHLRTTPQFRSDFDKVVSQLDGFEERNGQAYKNSVGGTSYKLTADQKKYRRKIATDFAKKYGYSIESFPTDQQMIDDESLNLLDNGLLNMKGNLLKEDLKTYDSKWKRVNELKSGFQKAGYQVDGDYNIRWDGYVEGNINDIINAEKEMYSLWDFEANDGKGDFVFDGSNEGAAYYANEDCRKRGKVFDVKTGVCVDDPDGSGMIQGADYLKPEYETDVTGRYAVKAPGQYESYMERYGHMPQGTGSSDQFWLATLLGPSSIPGVVGSLTAETGITPFIDPAVDFAFDAMDMVSGNPAKQAAAFTKYAAPIQKNWNAAVSRYNKADGFFDSIGAFFNLEEGGPVGAYGPGDKVSPVNITSYYNFGTPRTPEEWEQEIRTVEREIGNPRGWTMDDYNTMQDKLNEYKAWREKNTWVRDSSNKPNEYVIPLPPHLNAEQGKLIEKKNGGEDDILRPKGDPYEYKKVGDKYYTRRREGEWESEEQPGWDLATGESEDAIKYNVFKETRPEPVVETTIDERFPLMTYDPNNPNDFYARYYNERNIDQSQDALKPEYFKSNYKLNIPEWMNVNNNDEEYELWKAQTFKPGRRAPSWLEKNVFKPIGKEIDKFRKTDFGPIEDMADFTYDMVVDPVVTLASDFYNEPNKTSGEVLQMMVDGVTLPFDAGTELIRTNIVEPEEEFDTSTLGSPTSIERAGQVLAIAPWAPPVAKAITKGGKTAKVVNAVDGAADDVVNVSNKKVISRPGTKKNFEAAPAGSSKPTMSAEEIQAIESSPYMKNQTQYPSIAERDYNRLVKQNPNHPMVKKVESGEIKLLKMNDPANPYSGFKLSDENFASIDNQVKLKLDRSKSVEGRKRIFEQEKAYIKEQYPEMSDNLINDAAEQATKARIAELEDLYITKNYDLKWTGNNELMNAYHSPGQAVSDVTNKNPIGVSNFEKTVTPVNRGQRIEFHPGNVDDAATIQHELGHGYSAGRDLPIEKEIMDLMEDASSKLNAKDKRAYNYLVKDNAKKNDLIKRMREHDPANKNLTDAELIDKYSKYGQSKQPLGKEDWTFSNEIESVMAGSSEAIPYAQELKQVLLDQGLIDDWFQEVTPSMLAKSNALNKAQPRGLYFADMTGQMTDDFVVATNTRLLDLTNPAKYGDLAKILNKIAPVASVPIAAGTMLDNN